LTLLNLKFVILPTQQYRRYPIRFYNLKSAKPDHRSATRSLENSIYMCVKTTIILLVFLIVSKIDLFSQTQNIDVFNWKGSVIGKDNLETIPNASVKIFSNGRIFLFIADSNGNVDISYIYPTKNDSILVTSIGYKHKTYKCANLLHENKIILETDIIAIQEVTILPQKIRTKKLGNPASFTILTAAGTFGDQKVLFIPNNNEKSRLLKIRYYMKDYTGENRNHHPFRVRVYDKDTINQTIGKDLLGDNLIVSLNKGHWLEVDISKYNIELSRNGIFVGLEILPKDYYISNRIITSTTFRSQGKNILNGVCVGVTKRSKKSRVPYESWNYIPPLLGWTRQYSSDFDYLFNIIVEPQL